MLHILTIPTWNTCIAIWLWHVWYILRRCERCALRFTLANFERAYFQFSIGKESIGNAWFGPVHIRIYICQWNPIVTLRIFAASVNEFFDRTGGIYEYLLKWIWCALHCNTCQNNISVNQNKTTQHTVSKPQVCLIVFNIHFFLPSFQAPKVILK